MWKVFGAVVALMLAAAMPAAADNDAGVDGNITGSSTSVLSAPAPAAVDVAALPTPPEESGSTEVGFAPPKPSDAVLDPPTNDF